KLREAARLVARRHHEKVAAGDDAVGEPLVVAVAEREPLRMRIREGRKRGLEQRIAAAEDREPGSSAREELGQRTDEEIEALLLDEASNRADERRMVDEPELGAELELHLALPGSVAAGVAGADEWIGLGTPQRVVDAVQDADEVGAARAQQPVEPHPEL